MIIETETLDSKGMASGRFSAAYKTDNDKKETRLESYMHDFFHRLFHFPIHAFSLGTEYLL
jgi:hypothetical protein